MASKTYRSIALTKPQADYLAAEAARLAIPVAELIRRIIDQYRETKRP